MNYSMGCIYPLSEPRETITYTTKRCKTLANLIARKGIGWVRSGAAARPIRRLWGGVGWGAAGLK